MLQRKRRRRKPQRGSLPIPPANEPNDLWCQDYKGWFRVGDGQRCDPFTLTDATSRMLLACEAFVSPKLQDVQRSLEKAFRTYGLPKGILSDNGPPFGSTGPGGLTRLGVWLLRLRVTPHFIEPGHPEQNGRHERFHLTLKQETASPPRRSIRAQQLAFRRFQTSFNEERPHEALDMATPSSIYRPSGRSFPSKLPGWDYPEDVVVRRVRSCGTIKWLGDYVRIGQAFTGELVALDEVSDGVLEVRLGNYPLGLFHEGSRKLIPAPAG